MKWIYTQADKMEKFFRKLVKNYFTGVPMPNIRISHFSKGNIVADKGDNAKNYRRAPPRTEARQPKHINDDESSGRSESRKQLVSKLKELNPEQLGEVVELIMNANPEVCRRREDNFQICIPQIEGWLWADIKE